VTGIVDAGRELVERVLAEVRRVELLDRSYTVAASAFVALLPLTLVITGIFSSNAADSPVAQQLIDRLGLEGTAASAVRILITGGNLGLYPLGLVIVLYSAFSLSRRVARAYCVIWQVPQLPLGQQWRGLVWILVQVALLWSIAALRDAATTVGAALSLVVLVAAVTCWFVAEAASQHLLTMGRIPWRRLRLAAAFVAVGRLLMSAWFTVYMAGSLSRQAEQYGPIGVVFALFTGLFVVAAVILGGTLLAAVLTEPRNGTGSPAASSPGGSAPAASAAEGSDG
jgi:uncharacterized BrkB/YihY/UPF0761 family membrane protein